MAPASTLYLVHQKGGQVLIFTQRNGTWRMTRMPPQQLAKVHIIMSYGHHGWTIKEGGVKIQSQLPLADQDPLFPPLGTWHGSRAFAGDWTLQEEKPQLPPLPRMEPIDTGSATMRVVEEDSGLVRVDFGLHSQPLTDQVVEELMETMREGIREMARRPDATMLFTFTLQGAAIPAMRHVKRLISLSHEIGELLFLVARGSAMILRPQGFLGSAMVAIVRFVQTAAAAPWPETIVPTMEEAEAFLLTLRPSCLSPSMRGISNATEEDPTPSNVESELLDEGASKVRSAPRAHVKSVPREDSMNLDLWVPSEHDIIERKDAGVQELEPPG
ncbi:unnamed protein product [Effrenium voratum]|uniref:Uncharacterized protein n=1 Tax=Effrenium voratum TaxID=2562239 RepID=A0AA36IN25_9DINO|nr:unnamed protein product [Effrenium voratum]CAJ1456370.1 unnamed protein product [Effrenium voratum]